MGCRSTIALGIMYMETYQKLLDITKSIIQFRTAMGIVQWDLRTYMPPRGLEQRSEQLALLRRIAHRMATDEQIENILNELEKKKTSYDSLQQREIEQVRRSYERRSKVPEDLIAAEIKQKTITTSLWQKAKQSKQWSVFEPELEKLLLISKQHAEIMMESVGSKTPYDAMLDIYEPRMTAEQLTKVFKDLRTSLVPLVKKYTSLCEDVRTNFMNRTVPVPIQKILVEDLVNQVGFDTKSNSAGGRIDEAEHPFTSAYYDDSRMTIHYFEDDVFRAIFGALHEAGHAIHGQNHNPDWKWMALGESCSSGFNESQSRFVENIIGRSPEFWRFYHIRFNELTNKSFEDIPLEELVRAINIVRPSKIRVMADEMTYALHIIVRFEIELDLFHDRISVSEIPQSWNEKYEDYLGVEVEFDDEGALQDTHWAWGYWGYFPSYALGNLYSAMIADRMESDIPAWKNDIAEGRISTVINWLIEHVHQKSNLYDPSEMIEHITGKSLTAEPFLQYLERKYSSLYS
ncbi:carboxypeptidase M32 [Candidatus Thorarchaeota archaeon]|nr:MAG: carboxypeptidase M32 [Candidatus Thorarchaeota archaeon]